MDATCKFGRGRTSSKGALGPDALGGRAASRRAHGPGALRFGGALLALSVVGEGACAPLAGGEGPSAPTYGAPGGSTGEGAEGASGGREYPGSVKPLGGPVDPGDIVCEDGDEECEMAWLSARVSAERSGPIGSGGTGPGNGLGLYVVAASNSDYCFSDAGGQPAFCPETFLNGPDGVLLRMRDAHNGIVMYTVPVQASLRDETVPGSFRPVDLVAVESEATKLTIVYASEGQKHALQGDELGSIRLDLPAPNTAAYSYHVRFKPSSDPPPIGSPPLPYGAKTPKWLQRYYVDYFIEGAGPATGTWRPHCTVGTTHRHSSFLGQTMVDGLLGQVSFEPAATTMACETGSIDTCLSWDYTPVPAPGSMASRYLYGTCLQAKRAAYFVGPHGYDVDLMSYTINGTLIDLEDVAKVVSGPVEHLEAVWGPDGVVCLNRDNLRRPELIGHPGFEAPTYVPSCPPGDWRELGPMATGRRWVDAGG